MDPMDGALLWASGHALFFHAAYFHQCSQTGFTQSLLKLLNKLEEGAEREREALFS